MKICFVQQSFRLQFGIAYLSAICKNAGYKTDVYIYSRYNVIPTADVYAISSSTSSWEEDLKIIKQIKAYTKKPIIVGGPYPTYNHDKINEPEIDSICVGEGYEAILEFIKDPTIKKFMPRKLYDINKLPMPDYGLYYNKYSELRNNPTKQVYIVRGCPYQCAFCYNPAYNRLYNHQNIIQCMDIDKAIDQIKKLHSKWGFKWLQFMSDTMNLNIEWFKELVSRYSVEVGKPYLCNIRVNNINEGLIEVMARTGCNRVDFGVEHGDEYLRNKILKRNMPDDMMINAGKILRKYKIRVQTTNIFGLPEETLEKAIKTVELNRKIKPEIAKACVLQPFSGTDIYQYAETNGLLQNMEYNSGTTFQRDFEGRGGFTKIKLKDEKKLIRMSYLLDFFVQHWYIPKFIIYFICSLPLDNIYKTYYNRTFQKIEAKYK